MLRVLIVDDESAERDGLSSLMRKYHFPFDIILKENGEAALEVLREQKIDILISDIVMPRMDGLTLCTKAIELQPKIVTIISSAYSDFQYTQAAIRIGVDDYLLKPIVLDSFQNTLNRSIELVRKKNDSNADESIILEDNSNRLIQDVRQLILDHYREPIGLEWVADQMYLSPGYLSSLFKRKTNQTILQYITLCRMRRACYLLTKTNIKVIQIGQEVGYPNPSYFGYLFRKIFNITPNQLREGVSPDVMEKIQSILE